MNLVSDVSPKISTKRPKLLTFFKRVLERAKVNQTLAKVSKAMDVAPLSQMFTSFG